MTKFNFKIDLFLQKGNDYIDIFVIIVVLTIDKVTLPTEQFLTLSKFIILKKQLNIPFLKIETSQNKYYYLSNYNINGLFHVDSH